MGVRLQRAWRWVIPVLVVSALGLSARAVWAGGDWNDAQVHWWSYKDGLAQAKQAHRPICLIFYTDWCPHCRNYSGVFHDARVVDKAKQFVMIRVNADQSRDLSQQFALDGAYIPRTFFLSPAGAVDASLNVGRDQYKYFYDEHNPASVLGGMDAALKKLR